jgi:hypothetical protein
LGNCGRRQILLATAFLTTVHAGLSFRDSPGSKLVVKPYHDAQEGMGFIDSPFGIYAHPDGEIFLTLTEIHKIMRIPANTDDPVQIYPTSIRDPRTIFVSKNLKFAIVGGDRGAYHVRLVDSNESATKRCDIIDEPKFFCSQFFSVL